jgi:hypothetical protein
MGQLIKWLISSSKPLEYGAAFCIKIDSLDKPGSGEVVWSKEIRKDRVSPRSAFDQTTIDSREKDLMAAQVKSPSEFDKLSMEYEQVNDNIRTLADIRFKLLALIPILGGVAIFALSTMAAPNSATGSTPDYTLALLVSVLGFIATLGITFYDQRNSELYNALIRRAQHLEAYAELSEDKTLEPPRITVKPVTTAKGTKKEETSEPLISHIGGQFLERPDRNRKLIGFFQCGTT